MKSYMRPSEIRFSQDSIASRFQNEDEINTSCENITKGELDAEDFPKIGVIVHNKKYYSVDNRRLYVFRVLEHLGFLEEIPVSTARYFNDKLTTENDGCHVSLRGYKDNNNSWQHPVTFRHCSCTYKKLRKIPDWWNTKSKCHQSLVKNASSLSRDSTNANPNVSSRVYQNPLQQTNNFERVVNADKKKGKSNVTTKSNAKSSDNRSNLPILVYNYRNETTNQQSINPTSRSAFSTRKETSNKTNFQSFKTTFNYDQKHGSNQHLNSFQHNSSPSHSEYFEKQTRFAPNQAASTSKKEERNGDKKSCTGKILLVGAGFALMYLLWRKWTRDPYNGNNDFRCWVHTGVQSCSCIS